MQGPLVELWVTDEHMLLKAALIQVGLVTTAEKINLPGYLPLKRTSVGAAADAFRVNLQVLF